MPTKDNEAIKVTALPAMKRGRPPLLGVKMDNCLKDLIVGMRERGTAYARTQVNSGTASELTPTYPHTIIIYFYLMRTLNSYTLL